MKTTESVNIDKAIDRLWPQDRQDTLKTRTRRDIIYVAMKEFGIPWYSVASHFLSSKFQVKSFMRPNVSYFRRPTSYVVTS